MLQINGTAHTLSWKGRFSLVLFITNEWTSGGPRHSTAFRDPTNRRPQRSMKSKRILQFQAFPTGFRFIVCHEKAMQVAWQVQPRWLQDEGMLRGRGCERQRHACLDEHVLVEARSIERPNVEEQDVSGLDSLPEILQKKLSMGSAEACDIKPECCRSRLSFRE